MYWIYDYPSWAIGALFCAVFVAVTWAGIFATRVTYHSWIHKESRANDMIGFSLTSYFVLFGILLGLLAVATYQNYTEVENIVDEEASAAAALYRDFGGYPEPFRSDLRSRIREYVHFTIYEAWPQQRMGRVANGGVQRIDGLVKIMFAFEPQTRREEVIDAEALREFNHFMELRRSRLANVSLGLPAVLWWVVAFGASLNIVLIWMLDMEIHVHLVLGTILASMLAAVIFLIATLDNPFRGEVSVGPDSFALVYDRLMSPAAGPNPQQR
jgi:hypothetical protein